MLRLCIIIPGLFWAVMVHAQEVSDCDWRASAWGIAEPWEEYTRTYSNGDVRIALIDMGEPATAAMYLLILSPPYNELGDRQCKLIGHGGGLGFGVIYFKDITSSYDPATGLRFDIPAMLILEDGFSNPANVSATLNQANGRINLAMELGRE